MLIMVNYGHNQIVGFREKCSQNLVKVGQTWSNLINGPETIGFHESIFYFPISCIIRYINT